ncbi:hypothetical protein Tco_1547094 [Tanacetum coccineum]
MKEPLSGELRESNIRGIRVKDIFKEVEDYLKTYSSAGMDIIAKGIMEWMFAVSDVAPKWLRRFPRHHTTVAHHLWFRQLHDEERDEGNT